MTPRTPISPLGMVSRTWRHNWVSLCGAGLIFIFATGLAVSFGAVVERLLASDATARASAARAADVQLIRQAIQASEYRDDGAQDLTGASLADVFDGSSRYRRPPWGAGTASRPGVDQR